MTTRIGKHLRGNAVAYLALFIALGGTAYALETDSIKSKHIKDTQVRTDDVADDTGPHALTGTDVAANSLGGADIDDSSLFGDNSLNGADIDESSLDLAKAGSGYDFACTDDDQDGELCGLTFLTLSRASDVYVSAASSAVTEQFNDGEGPGSGTDAPNLGEGHCEIVLDGVAVPNLRRTTYELQAATDAQKSGWIGLAITGVLDAVPAGQHQYALRCTETDGDVAWIDNQISALVIGDD